MDSHKLSISKIGYQISRNLKLGLKKVIPGFIWRFLKKVFPNWRGNKSFEASLINEWKSAREASSLHGEARTDIKGINLIGYLRATTGLGEAARNTLLAIEESGIPNRRLDFEFDVPDSQLIDTAYLPQTSEGSDYPVNIIHVNPLQMPYLWERFGEKTLVNHYNIGVWYWELPEFPDEWVPDFQVVDEVWAATDFVYAAIKAKSPVPVFKVPPAIHVECEPDLSRADFNLPEDRFLFLCAYDVLSVHERKNPMGAIEAFKRAFPQNDPSVGLVIKINNAKERPEEIARLKAELQHLKNCYFVEEVFHRKKFNALIGLIDAYVSLHRSEGFGLIPAEAMALGKPVIMTNWSGNVDFMTQDNACGVGYQLIPVGAGVWPYQSNQLWADPDLNHAAEYMNKLVRSPEYYALISRNARETIQSNYSPERAGQVIRSRLEALKLL